tara:strand:- start:2013 stop:2489 length:477 start_codon:yes stop_codon:yes gene_type:complete
MALAEDKANIKGDLYDVFVGGSEGPFQAGFTWSYQPTMHPVTTGRTGATPIAHLLMGVNISLEVTFQQMDQTELESLLGTGGSAPRNIPQLSDTPTTFVLKLRPVGAGDDADAIHIFEAVVGGIRYDNDGAEERKPVVTFLCQQNSSGQIGSVGPASE